MYNLNAATDFGVPHVWNVREDLQTSVTVMGPAWMECTEMGRVYVMKDSLATLAMNALTLTCMEKTVTLNVNAKMECVKMEFLGMEAVPVKQVIWA